MSALTDKLLKVGVAGTLTQMTSPGKALGASGFNIGSASNYPTDTAFIVAVRVVDNDGVEEAGTYTEWIATISGTALTINPTPVYGDDQVYAAGSTTQVFIPVSAYGYNRLIDALLEEHKQSGAHGDVTADSLATDTISEATAAAGVTIDGLLIKDSKLAENDSVVTSNITDLAVTTGKLADEAITSRKSAPTIISEQATGDVTSISSEVDITGCTTTFTPDIASVAIVFGVFYFNSGSAANDVFYGSLMVDSVNEAELVRYVVPTSGGGGTFAQIWVVPLTAASHTLKLRAGRTSGTGTAAVRQAHTKMLVWLVGDNNVTDS